MIILQLTFFGVLIIICYQDIKRMEIKDSCHIVITVLAAIGVFIEPEPGIVSRFFGALCISVPMLVLALIIPGAFGGGDVKLLAAAGLFLGWKATVVSAAFAIFAAGGYALLLLLKKGVDKKQQFPLGPFLSAGLAAGVLWGENLWQLWMSW